MFSLNQNIFNKYLGQYYKRILSESNKKFSYKLLVVTSIFVHLFLVNYKIFRYVSEIIV